MKTSHGTPPEAPRPRGQPGPGDRIGERYRLKELLGTGGMGTVWVARNTVLDIDVALKLIRVEQFPGNPQRLVRRVLQEARATARLEHPAIVRVFDFGLAESGAPYVVMELLHGETLAKRIAREPRVGATWAVQTLLPVADALATAHGRGIIHRDIKPENLFLAEDEYGRLQPKIVDFGVARFLDCGCTLTRSGALVGTPDYMAPEQARGEEGIDECIDIWALCVVLYELIAGFRPFGHRNANYLAVLRAIVHDPPNPRIRSVVDDGLWLILERGLRKKPRARWDTMRVLGEALALWLYEQGVREDILGASIKATWLQAGLGGVKIETSSMSPSLTSQAPLQLAKNPEALLLARPGAMVVAERAAPSLFDTVDEVPLPGNVESPAPEAPTAEERAEAEAPPPDADPEHGAQPRLVSVSPLARQTRTLRRLVLVTIGFTVLLALAVLVLLWDQYRATQALTAPDPPPAVPTAAPSVSAVVPKPAAAVPTAAPSVSAVAQKPAPALPAGTDEEPESETVQPRQAEADATAAATKTATSAPRPAARTRRSHAKKHNPQYELGF
jgi:serine/threonine protein kinase